MTVHTISGATLDLELELVKKIFKNDSGNTVIAHSENVQWTIKESVSQVRRMMKQEIKSQQLTLSL